MRANPYLVDRALKEKGRRMENIDPRAKDYAVGDMRDGVGPR